ncbi:acetylserotonin O-methyltransferase-like [Mauremys mutica]|uniref:acetylserotonin O-methyltransferase-like n=1 Tax=Mauremys mutica TaxID=74926 RepID=UPI001D157D5C|nr:acetylserotonin O-methyltransferase-like [Mauremys mutica]
MSSTEDLDYPQILFQYNNGFLVSKIMFTTCELGVFDLLLESEGPLSSDAIAEHLGTSVSGMERLLDACVGLKLLEVEMKSEGAFYRNTELSNLYLTKSSPKSQYHNLMYYSKTVYLCWHYLTDAVRDGKNQYERAFGVSSKDLFGALYRSEEEMIKFMYGLNAIWSICGRDVIAAFDLSPFTVIYDLGGDFFKDPIPEADLYILARILHDWADDKCMQLLAKIHKACKPGGGVLLVETLLNEDKTGPLEAQLYSMNMLVQAEGKERTPTEYRKLLAAAGFREIQVKKTGKLYDAILGRK